MPIWTRISSLLTAIGAFGGFSMIRPSCLPGLFRIFLCRLLLLCLPGDFATGHAVNEQAGLCFCVGLDGRTGFDNAGNRNEPGLLLNLPGIGGDDGLGSRNFGGARDEAET